MTVANGPAASGNGETAEGTAGTTLASVGEFGLIRRLTSRLGVAATTLIGPGDDAALVAAPDGRVVATCDVLVDGRHFRREWCSAEDVGHRAAAASLADVAAMGARANALLVALCVPEDLDPGWVERLADGLSAEAAMVGAAVVGGDLTASAVITVAVTALGDLDGRAPVLRSGARAGDVVALAGQIGLAAAGLSLLSRGLHAPAAAVRAYRRPSPPYWAGPAAAELGATAMIDVSDGLLADLGHVSGASRVGIDIRTEELAVAEPLREAAQALGTDPYQWILSGGDDHPLVACFPPGTTLDPGWRVIGEVREGSGVTVDGQMPPVAGGFDHFRRSQVWGPA